MYHAINGLPFSFAVVRSHVIDALTRDRRVGGAVSAATGIVGFEQNRRGYTGAKNRDTSGFLIPEIRKDGGHIRNRLEKNEIQERGKFGQ
jgi:hypothetical protein